MTFDTPCACGHVLDEHDNSTRECCVDDCDCFYFEADDVADDDAELDAFIDQTRVDLGGGMVVPLSELIDE